MVTMLLVTKVFAFDQYTVDTITVTIESACSLSATSGSDGNPVIIGQSNLRSDIDGADISVSCNDNSGWLLKAVGDGDEENKTNLYNFESEAIIETGTEIGGDDSSWAFKVTGDNALPSFNDFSEVPGTSTTVADYDGTGADSSADINATYQVWVSSEQETGIYFGRVTYTLVHPREI